MNVHSRVQALVFRRLCVGVLLSVPLAFVGCDSGEKAPISSKDTKFEVADDTKATGKGAEPDKVKPLEPPRFNPALTETLAQRSFESLKLPETQDKESLEKFMGQADLALRDLIIAFQAKQVEPAALKAFGRSIGGMKLQAAEKLEKESANEEDKASATMLIMQALSQMARFDDMKSAQRLESLAKELVANKSNPKLAHQAQLVLFSFLVSDYDGGKGVTSGSLLEALDRLTADPSMLGNADFDMLVRSMQVVERQGDDEAVKAMAKRIAKAFEENPDPKLMMNAWQIAVSTSVSMSNFQTAMKTIMTAPGDAANELLKESVAEFVNEFPAPGTMMVIASQAIQVEYSGSLDAAKIMFDGIAPKIDSIKLESMKKEIEKLYNDFQKRSQAIGKTFEFIELNTEAGEPFDGTVLKGKFVIVDFWATWCKPCREEFPNLREIYTEFKEKGLEIVGINLDEQLDDFKSFQQSEMLPWLLVRSSNDEKIGFKTTVAEQVAPSGIPLVLILDRDSKVIGMHVRGPSLKEKIASLFSEAPATSEPAPASSGEKENPESKGDSQESPARDQ